MKCLPATGPTPIDCLSSTSTQSRKTCCFFFFSSAFQTSRGSCMSFLSYPYAWDTLAAPFYFFALPGYDAPIQSRSPSVSSASAPG